MTIKPGDIVRSNGRIVTQQDGRRRYIEFEAALVLDVEGRAIKVNPVGRQAVLVAQEGDLHIAKAAPQVKTQAKAGPDLNRRRASGVGRPE